MVDVRRFTIGVWPQMIVNIVRACLQNNNAQVYISCCRFPASPIGRSALHRPVGEVRTIGGGRGLVGAKSVLKLNRSRLSCALRVRFSLAEDYTYLHGRHTLGIAIRRHLGPRQVVLTVRVLSKCGNRTSALVINLISRNVRCVPQAIALHIWMRSPGRACHQSGVACKLQGPPLPML